MGTSESLGGIHVVMCLPFPYLLVNSSKKILYVDDIGSPSSPKSETLDNKA